MQKGKKITITIDGPAGAGKSTVGKELARRLNMEYLDTGSLYRAIAFEVLRLGISAEDETGIAQLAEKTPVSIFSDRGQPLVFVREIDVTNKIRTTEIGMLASKISAVPAVRRALLTIQRTIGSKGGIVADGRDMGTVVFPGADFKFYLDAATAERSRRRFLELKGKDVAADFDQIQTDIISRDKQDMGREASPLRPAEDAVFINSTNMKIEEVVEFMLEVIEKAESGLVQKNSGPLHRNGKGSAKE